MEKAKIDNGRATTVVLGTIGVDAHVVGIYILRRALIEAGFKVAYLGAVVPPQDFIDAAVETKASSIWISSLYGMGMLDAADIKDRCTEAGLGTILLYIGGMLVATDEDWSITEKRFKDMGFDQVYPPRTLPSVPIADLKQDLGISE